MNEFNIAVDGKGSDVNSLIKQKMNQYDKDVVTQLYGGKLYDPRGVASQLGVVTEHDDPLGLLYTKKCHGDGTSYDLTCLEDMDEDLLDVINEIDDRNLGYDPNREINRIVKKVTIFDTNMGDSVKGNFTESLLSYNFMSKINANVIQDMIRYEVYKKTNQYISIQSNKELFIIMRSILLQHGDMSLTDKRIVIRHIKQLNKLIIKYSVDNIIQNMSNYNKYINELDKLIVPVIDIPENTQYYTDTDAQSYALVDIDPLSYYPGYSRNLDNTNKVITPI